MGRGLRLFEGGFGRLVLTELAPSAEIQAQGDPAIVVQQGAAEIILLNPGDVHVALEAARALALHPSGEWLRAGFPAAFAADDPRPFPDLREPITPRIRQLADPLAVQTLRHRLLSTARPELILQ